MEEKILIALGSCLLPASLGGIGLVIAMRVEIAILKEKVAYQSEQIRDILKNFPAIKRE